MESRRFEAISKPVERALIVGLILLGWALILIFRLFDLQVLAHDNLVKRAHKQQEKLQPVEARRGSIFDRNGNLLAISSPSLIVIADPRRIPDKPTAAALLSSVLSLDPQRLEASLEVAAASKHHSGYFVVDQHVSDEQAASLRAMNLDWLNIREGSVRSYPNNDVAAHVLGNLNGDGKGVAGVELKLDKDLTGTPGSLLVERDAKASSYASEIVKAATPGKDVGLTIDRELSYVAKNTLKDAVVKNHADHGSLIALNPQTGEILALENYPTYDPNEHLLPGEKPRGREDLAAVAPFEPGSVFKLITLSAALETTNLTPDSVINCGNGVMKMFSRVIHDHKPYSALSMADVLAFSSNIGAIRIGMQVGNKNLYDYIRRFGFGSRTGIELPAEAPGLLRPLNRWQPTTIGSIPMGHELAVTSVQLAQAGSVIANGGFLIHPHLVAWKQEGGKRVSECNPPPRRVLNPHTVAEMRMMMRRVMTEKGGTGEHIHVTGYTIAGKTGTAQIYDYAHHIYTHRYNASFLGFGPIQNPSMLVVVTISGTSGLAGYGGTAAGPVFERVMASSLRREGVAPDAPQDIDDLIAKEAKEKEKDKPKETDDTALAELNPPTAEEMQQASGNSAGASNDTAYTEPNAPKVPNFVGKTVQDVMEEAAATGIQVDFFGNGMARTQTPAPGALLEPGAHIAVRFAR
ncbi:MAG TPA: penicillin-binding protein [Bryobacteraceae bacterium]|jgi:cell division protein FtsI (penicillin-binding protein 3)|nr:penicillin-binding protein [Bryobacteraceae bacterium]